MIWVLFLTFSWRFYKYNLSKSLCFEFCQFSFRVPGGAIWPGPIFWARDGKNTFVWIYSICHTNSHLQQKSYFFLRIPSTIRHERVRPVLSPTQPGYRARKSQSMKTEVLYTLYLPFCLNFEYFFRKLRDIFFARLLQPLKYLSYFDYYYFLWLISLSTFWLICATPLISKNYAVKFF